MQFFLCVVMLMAFSVQKASADDWNNAWIKQRFNPVNATPILISAYIKIGVAAVTVIADSAAMMVISL